MGAFSDYPVMSGSKSREAGSSPAGCTNLLTVGVCQEARSQD